jgi:hypothetical protein
MGTQRPASSAWQSRTTCSLIRLATWTGAWVVTMALATFGPEFLWEARWLTLLAVLINLGFGMGMIRANIRHLKVLDELMQKVQLEAMGLSLGAGVVGGLSYSLLDTTNLMSSDAEIAFLVMLIGITYLVSVVVGVRRYR